MSLFIPLLEAKDQIHLQSISVIKEKTSSEEAKSGSEGNGNSLGDGNGHVEESQSQ